VGLFGDALDTSVGWAWMITIDGVPFTEITQVDGVKIVVDSIELKTNTATGQYLRKKLPGKMKSGQLTLTRGAIGPPSAKVFTDWLTDVFQGNMSKARKTVVITILDYMAAPVATFCAKNAWPTSIEYGSFKAGDANVMTEKIVLDHEGLYVGDKPGDW
jgi:phage tail-like protein